MVKLAEPPRKGPTGPTGPVSTSGASSGASLRVDCLHCGLALARSRPFGEFCCAGCRHVHGLLASEGLERYYELRGAKDVPAPEPRADALLWLDPLLARAPLGHAGTRRLVLDLQGVHCAACVWLLEELWARHDGAVELRVNPALGRAELAWDPARFEIRDYLRSAMRFGYRFGPPRKDDRGASRGLVVRMAVSLAAALNTMVFSLCYYLGLAPAGGDGALYTIFGRWNFALATLAVLVGGSLFLGSAWRGLRRGLVHLDLPIATGILFAYGGSVWAWLARGPEAAYFDTLTIFVALMVVGRWLSERVLEKNRHSLLSGDGVEDLWTRRRRGAELATIPAARIARGDELWIPPGDVVPVAGTLLAEPATMSLAWITGESRPRTFQPGESVPAGAFHAGEKAARIAAEEEFAASRLHALFGAPRTEAERERRRDRGMARFSAIYATGVLALAALGFFLWRGQGFERAVEVALSIMVVTCPCALGLALPLAHELAHVSLRRRGIFLSDADLLRRVLTVRHVLFDKTGTLTRGALVLSERSRRALHELDDESRRVLAHATAQSLHPASRAIHAALEPAAPAKSTPLVEGLEVRECAGRGLEARRGTTVWRLGRADFAATGTADLVGAPGPAGAAGTVDNIGPRGSGAVFARDGRVLLELELEEDLKVDAREEVRLLEAQGLEVHVLSGDREERVRRVSSELGVAPARVHGGLSPEDKARLVRALDRRDTWMVGDGINDGPAFDAAWCAATPAVDRPSLPARAGLFYFGDGIGAVRATRDTARRLARVLRTNLALATAYNVAAVAACLCGLVGPLAAAVLMPASSIGFLTLTWTRLSRGSAA